jgi:hypothetical protein
MPAVKRKKDKPKDDRGAVLAQLPMLVRRAYLVEVIRGRFLMSCNGMFCQRAWWIAKPIDGSDVNPNQVRHLLNHAEKHEADNESKTHV